MNGGESRLTLRVAISRRVGVRPGRRSGRADCECPGSPASRARGERLIQFVGGQVDLQQRRERRQAGLDRRVGVQRVGPLLGRLVGVADDRLGQKKILHASGGRPSFRIRALKAS